MRRWGDSLPFQQGCIDIDYCTNNQCGVHGQGFDGIRTGCDEAQERMSFAQRSVIVGVEESDAMNDYFYRFQENFQTGPGPGGAFTCHADDSTGHS